MKLKWLIVLALMAIYLVGYPKETKKRWYSEETLASMGASELGGVGSLETSELTSLGASALAGGSASEEEPSKSSRKSALGSILTSKWAVMGLVAAGVWAFGGFNLLSSNPILAAFAGGIFLISAVM